MKNLSRGITGTTLLGLVTGAALEIGFFSWRDASDHKQLLAADARQSEE